MCKYHWFCVWCHQSGWPVVVPSRTLGMQAWMSLCFVCFLNVLQEKRERNQPLTFSSLLCAPEASSSQTPSPELPCYLTSGWSQSMESLVGNWGKEEKEKSESVYSPSVEALVVTMFLCGASPSDCVPLWSFPSVSSVLSSAHLEY